MTDVAKFTSDCMASLSAMVQLELPHVNILSKMDLVRNKRDIEDQYGPKRKKLYQEISLSIHPFSRKRVSLKVLTNQESLKRSAASFNKDCEPEPVAEYSFSSSDCEGKKEEMDQNTTLLESRQSQSHGMIELANSTDSSCSYSWSEYH